MESVPATISFIYRNAAGNWTEMQLKGTNNLNVIPSLYFFLIEFIMLWLCPVALIEFSYL